MGISGDDLKSIVKSFAADYSYRLNLVRFAAQTACGKKVNRTIKSRDSREVDLAVAQLCSLLIKKDEALVVRDKLKRISSEATNMAVELRTDEVINAANRQIACVTLPDKQSVTTNTGICEAFLNYF